MGSFGISREFEFKVGNHGEPCTKSCVAREEECFYREEKEVERIERVNRINKEPMASHWLSSCQGRRVFLLPIGSAFSQDMKALFLQGFGVSQLYLIEVSVYTFFFSRCIIPQIFCHSSVTKKFLKPKINVSARAIISFKARSLLQNSFRLLAKFSSLRL